MSIDHTRREAASAALVAAAAVAGYAPSIHNTQPWRWRVDAETLELYADATRQLSTTDPLGRLMILSCGAALHHARVALAAEGWRVDVERLPEPERPDLLARVMTAGQTAVTGEAMRLLQTVRVRHTDRRPVTDTPVDPGALQAIRVAVEGEHAWLHTLRTEDLSDLAIAAERAQTLETFDPQWRSEMAYWAGGSRADGLGVPDSAIPGEAIQATVPGRDFGHHGNLPVSTEHDRGAVYAILFGIDDTRWAWLHAGEALSAGWLAAIEHGVSVVPLSATVEVDGTRVILRRLISRLGAPYLVLRLGIADPHHPGPGRTGRLPSAQVIDVVGGA